MRPFQQRFKGRHELKRYDNGLEKMHWLLAVRGGLPGGRIWVEASENTDEGALQPGRALRQHLRNQYAALHLLRLL